MQKIFKLWLPFAVTVSAFCALTYALVQQAYRQDANDPQIQMAQDAARALDNGAVLTDLVPIAQVDISHSLAPFIVVYDLQGNPVAGSGVLAGQLPAYPQGALDSAKPSGENRVTWQPAAGVRVASVVVPYKDGFVMAGRNLREVEKREDQAFKFAAITWVLAMAASLVVIAFGEWALK